MGQKETPGTFRIHESTFISDFALFDLFLSLMDKYNCFVIGTEECVIKSKQPGKAMWSYH